MVGRWTWTGSVGRTTTSSPFTNQWDAHQRQQERAPLQRHAFVSHRSQVGKVRAPDAARGLRLRPDAGAGTGCLAVNELPAQKPVGLRRPLSTRTRRASGLCLSSLFTAIRARLMPAIKTCSAAPTRICLKVPTGRNARIRSQLHQSVLTRRWRPFGRVVGRGHG